MHLKSTVDYFIEAALKHFWNGRLIFVSIGRKGSTFLFIAKNKEINHMDAVLYYCEKNNLEPDSIGRLITKGLKEKIEANARELNFLEKTATSPI